MLNPGLTPFSENRLQNKGVFVRESTGLTKNVSLLDALSMNLGSMEVGLALGSIGYTMVLLPSVSGANMIVASIIALLIVIPQVIVYQMFMNRMARTGGDYVWASRSFGGAGGVLAFGGAIMIQLAYAALAVIATVFAIGSVGLALGNQSFLGLALPGNIPGANPPLQFVIGGTLYALIVALNVFRPKAGFRLVSISIVLGVVLLALATVVPLLAGQTGVANYINSLNAVGSNNQTITYNSLASSYTGPTFDLGNTLMFMPFFIFFSYPWFATGAPTVASEFKGANTTRFNIPLSLLITFTFATIPLAVMYDVGGIGFTNAALSNPTLVYNYSFNFWTLSMGVSGNPVISFLIGLGWILWNVALLGYLVISFSRYLLAQGFDRFLPARFAEVSRFGSPWVAHVVDLVVTLIMAGLAGFLYGIFSALYGIALNNWIWFISIGVAAIVYSVRKMQGSARLIMAISGALMTIVYLYISYVFLEYPGIWGGNSLAYGYDAAVFIIGAALYAGSWYYHRSKGINIGLAFKAIPPE